MTDIAYGKGYNIYTEQTLEKDGSDPRKLKHSTHVIDKIINTILSYIIDCIIIISFYWS